VGSASQCPKCRGVRFKINGREEFTSPEEQRKIDDKRKTDERLKTIAVGAVGYAIGASKGDRGTASKQKRRPVRSQVQKKPKRWGLVFGIILIVLGSGSFSVYGIVSGVSLLIAGLLCLPFIKIKRWLKFVFVIALVALFYSQT